jgi:hypothetical protein
LGGQITYGMDDWELWAGTSFQKYYYYIPEELRGYVYRKSYEEDGRSLYIGGEYAFGNLTVALDLTYTASSIYLDDEFNDKEDITAQINLNWML